MTRASSMPKGTFDTKVLLREGKELIARGGRFFKDLRFREAYEDYVVAKDAFLEGGYQDAAVIAHYRAKRALAFDAASQAWGFVGLLEDSSSHSRQEGKRPGTVLHSFSFSKEEAKAGQPKEIRHLGFVHVEDDMTYRVQQDPRRTKMFRRGRSIRPY